MKRRKLLLGMLSLIPAVATARYGRWGNGGGNACVLQEYEKEDLYYMREEEKLARDVYIMLHDMWNTRVHWNIAQSEQRHTLAVKVQIEKNGLVDPVIDDSVGVFQNESLQALYEQLVDLGSKSKLDSFMVGALIEEIDMIDIVDAYNRSECNSVKNMYSNLLSGSESHLRAFARQVVRITGKPYVAQMLPQAVVDEILGV